jgi:thiamine kinase-like enzyme
MASTSIYWEKDDLETGALVRCLGGADTLSKAVGAVLPERKVKLRVLTPGISGAAVFLASPESFQGGRPRDEVHGVLKIGTAQALCKEVENYSKWVKPLLAHTSQFALLDSPYELSRIANEEPEDIQALYYRRVGPATLGERLKELVVARDIPAARRLVDALLIILRPWQEDVSPQTSGSLTSAGVYAFGADPFDAFEETCARLNQAYPPDDAIPDSYRRVRELWHPNALEPERLLESIVHGDLHMDNVLVDSNGGLTLIDFAATGQGHFLRDLSTLEVHLVLRGLSPPGSELSDQHRAYLAEVSALYSRRAFLRFHLTESVTPLEAVVMRVRRYAFYSLMRCNLDYVPQYALAVLRHAVRVCARVDSAFSDPQRWIAARVATTLRESLQVERRRLIIDGTRDMDQLRAYSFLDKPHQLGPGVLAVARSAPCRSETWTALARSLRGARRVDVVGIAPPQLISAILDEWDDPGGTATTLPRVRYLTRPQRSDAPAGQRPTQLWEKAALGGVRNILTCVAQKNIALNRFASAAEGVGSNCLIRSISRDDHTTLHLAARVSEPETLEHAYVLLELGDDECAVADWVESTFARAKPIVIHEVECDRMIPVPDPEVAPSSLPPLKIQRLSPYGAVSVNTDCLRPIALTILRSRGPAGRQVVVRKRSRLVDDDEFDKLSFLSARILAADVAGAARVTMPDAEDANDALDALWNSVKQPDPFCLKKEVFVHAARRNVYATTLLDMPAKKFVFKGMHVIKRNDGIQLGFSVLTVDLTQDEVSAARKASRLLSGAAEELLQVVSVSDLLSGRYPVNRLMRYRKEWLEKHCL